MAPTAIPLILSMVAKVRGVGIRSSRAMERIYRLRACADATV